MKKFFQPGKLCPCAVSLRVDEFISLSVRDKYRETLTVAVFNVLYTCLQLKFGNITSKSALTAAA